MCREHVLRGYAESCLFSKHIKESVSFVALSNPVFIISHQEEK